ncbi:MAG: glycine oxidase ThiO [Alphaproteobacteria bacterium]|nr:glycine oxidase ThiO [Alphaproteobacteria bacterium]MBV9694705.1 glycine oxidase ThiO [Alphaproteobacteria bacterium]
MRVVVVGAGAAGLAIGWRLAQKGVRVTVIDRAQPGRGATWAAAGMIAAAAENGEAPSPETELGREARALWPAFAQEIEEISGMTLRYVQDAALLVATTQDQSAQFEQRARASNELVSLSPDEARRMEPLLGAPILAALLATKEARVDNRALGEALALCLRKAGGRIVPNEPVMHIETEGPRGLQVSTPFGLYEADAVVLAAGAWSGQIPRIPAHALPPVLPYKGEMISLLPPQGVLLPQRVVWGNDVYLVPRAGRLLIGATLTQSGFDTRTTAEALDWLSARAVALMPSLRDWRIEEHWSGLRPGSPDGLPMLGPTGVPGLYLASGQHRNGILFAPSVAEILSRSVLERSDGPKAFDPRRFGTALAPGPGRR